jgi:hypothetical protein
MTPTRERPATLLEALVVSLRACDATPDGVARPAAILWTDPKREWLPLKSALLKALPELIVLGDYAPPTRTGPAIWVRCVVDRTLPEPQIPEDRVPIVYMPGVGRQDLRAGEECPFRLKPLIELVYRGTMWLQRGGHDWTVSAFLTSPHGLGLDMARDQATLDALARALREVAETPLGHLRARRLEAEDFDRLLSSDVVRELLRWMSDSAGARERMGAERWQAFCNQCRAQFKLDPERDGAITASERLGTGEGPWEEVWQRFEEAPQAYPGIPDLLRRAKPGGLLFDRSRWPDENDRDEETVREALRGLGDVAHAAACTAVLKLESDHGPRREWVWDRLGWAPMAQVLKPLARLARIARSALGGSTPDEIATQYVAGAWEADAASWEAIALAPVADERLVKQAVRALLEPWLDETARAFQKAVESHPLPGLGGQETVAAEAGGCLLFADGLRYDLARRLAERLESRGCRVRVGWRWAALPTVTASSKPAVTPVASQVSGFELPDDLTPTLRTSGKRADAAALRAAMVDSGYQILGTELGDWPASDEARGWLETGQLDRRGHDLGDDLARHIHAELDRLAEQVVRLLGSGWRSIRIVTDHGWLFLPGGLPRVDLPRHLTASRWSRCAVISGESQVRAHTAPWHWNERERFATTPGVACFNASQAYAHGGLSIQECLVPDLFVERGESVAPVIRIRAVTWRGMRCFVETDGVPAGICADLRLNQATGASVAASVKTLDKEGTTSLVVADDQYEDADLMLVLLNADGVVLAQKKTKVGAME